MESTALVNVYKIMKNFGKLYAIMSDEEKRYFLSYKRNSNISKRRIGNAFEINRVQLSDIS